MATQITNYKCPACTGPLHFVGSSGKLECDYCGSTYDVDEIEKLYADADENAAAAMEAEEATPDSADGEWDMSSAGSEWGSDADNIRVYNCPSCGAELICDDTTAASSCPYCGNPTVVPGQLSGSKKPDYIIPFKLDKESALTALKNHYKGKPLLPKEFADKNHLEELQGVYVPFWLFDGKAYASADFDATRSRSHREGNYEVTDTDHFAAHRSGSVSFKRVPVDASDKMDDSYMDSIEPFDYSELKDFSTAYLPGYLANKYDVSKEDCSKRADDRCTQSAIDAMAETVVGYETVSCINANVTLERGQVKYALMPVWMLHTKWNGKDYQFAMNGQTGKLIGDLPVSMKKFWLLFGGIFAAVLAVSLLLFM